MKKFSSFKIGLVLIVIGSIWMGVVFAGSEKISYKTNLDVKETASLDLYLTKSGVGFYTTTIPDYAKHVLSVQILDPNGNAIANKKIATKMAVNYFDFSRSGKYIMKISNISERPVGIEVYFGNTRAYELLVPSFVAFCGAGIITFSGYKKLSNQSTAQPEEKIS